MIFNIIFLPIVCAQSSFFPGPCTDDGGSWRRECNTCECVSGRISCTTIDCSEIGGTEPCTCINPFQRDFNSHIGDPDVTCKKRNNPFCYVDCKANCGDVRAARGAGRCWSNKACDGLEPISDRCEPGSEGVIETCGPCNCRGTFIPCECKSYDTCFNGGDRYCEVDCRADCRDRCGEKNGKCYSSVACSPVAASCEYDYNPAK